MENPCLTFSETKEVEIKWKNLSVISVGDWLSYLLLYSQLLKAQWLKTQTKNTTTTVVVLTFLRVRNSGGLSGNAYLHSTLCWLGSLLRLAGSSRWDWNFQNSLPPHVWCLSWDGLNGRGLAGLSIA